MLGVHAPVLAVLALAEPRPTAEIAVVGDPADAGPVVRRVASFLADEPLEVQWREASQFELDAILSTPPVRGQLAIVVIELRADEARVFITDDARMRTLLRRFPLTRGIDELALENIAHCVESSLQGLLDGGRLDVVVDPAPPLVTGDPPPPTPEAEPPVRSPAGPPVEPRTVAPRRAPLVGALEVGYGMRVWSASPAMQHGPTVRAWIGRDAPRLDVWGGVEFGGWMPREAGRGAVAVRIAAIGLRALGRLGLRSDRIVGATFTAAAGVELQLERPLARSSAAEPAATSTHGVPSLGVQASARVRLRRAAWGDVHLLLGPSLDVLPRRLRYRTDVGEAFVPWLVRPGVTLGVVVRPRPRAGR